jgi:hypothetical protein
MTPDEYERFVADWLRSEGWETTVTPSRGDLGLDVIGERGGVRLGVQVKLYRAAGRPVNAGTVMTTAGAARYADCDRAMIATDGRVLESATDVAAKLDVEIRQFPTDIPPPSPAASSSDGHADAWTFGRVWKEHVEPLAGRTLRRQDGSTNDILDVDERGVTRRTSRNKTQVISIDIFRWTIERLLSGQVVLREDINAQDVTRVSSGVVLILGSLSIFEITTVGRKRGLRVRDDG